MKRQDGYFKDKRILVFGASGGIGRAIASECSSDGAFVIGCARRKDRIENAFSELGIRGITLQANLADGESLANALTEIERRDLVPDHVILAAGHDVRAPFEAHGIGDIRESIAVNLESLIAVGSFYYEKFIARGHGTITYVGGFGDGSVAFPFYSVDVATRAAAAKFLESLNREVPAPLSEGGEKRPVRFLYFGPTAATTDGERDYLELWRKMGTPIVSPEVVARELLSAIKRNKTTATMGGATTKIGILINAVSSRLADIVFMNSYRAIMEPRFRAAKKES